MSNKNVFGGANHRALYVPMSEDEQEVISRLVEMNDLAVHILGWGVVKQPRVTFGDLRLSMAFRLSFDRPEVPMPVYFFDLELRTSGGLLLFAERQSITYAGQPVQVAAGVFFDMVWDIAIAQIDPNIVKTIKPGTIGLTTRVGNMKLNDKKKNILQTLREGEAKVRRLNKAQASKASKLARGGT